MGEQLFHDTLSNRKGDGVTGMDRTILFIYFFHLRDGNGSRKPVVDKMLLFLPFKSNHVRTMYNLSSCLSSKVKCM